MSRFEKFKTNYDEAIEYINSSMGAQNSEMNELVKWLLETDYNPYGFLPENFAGHFNSAEGFASLLHMIHHAVYDDGDITFVRVDGEPRIVFIWKNEENLKDYALHAMELDNLKRGITTYDIDVMPIKPNEFGVLYDAYQVSRVKDLFIDAAAVDGLEEAINNFKDLKEYDPSWPESCAVEIEKMETFYTSLSN